ncbi:MAG: glycosyltransferase family 39 protein [Verrucomicrobiaceae bacterium]|nr:glycosyltransferase family 39 protein [Verrucomicrobiaceae bacterium]
MAEPTLFSRLSASFAHPRTALSALLLIFFANTISVVLRHDDQLIWDEGRYVECALNHLGTPVPTFDPNDFVNGPGYPLVLAPFVLASEFRFDQQSATSKIKRSFGPLFLARLLNAFFMTGAAAFVYLTLRHYTNPIWATLGALWTGLHPAILWMSFALMTEPLALFCLTGFLWSFCQTLRSPSTPWRWLTAATAFLGWLTLTRVFFGHVIVATGLLSLIAWPILKAWRPALQRTLLILTGALIICAPYLHHTWKVTGTFPCWSTNSGELLYWMTSHHPGENGHWFSYEDAQNDPHLAPNHRAFFKLALSKPVAEREALFKSEAKHQFTPPAFAYNWLCNLSRLAFGFPRSFQAEELLSLPLIFLHLPLILATLLAAFIALRFWRSIPPEIWILAAFATFYLGGTSLASGLPRYFAAITPILFIVTATILHRHLRLQFGSPPK